MTNNQAHQWFTVGDHPEDGGPGEKVVGYYRHPYVSGKRVCEDCGHTMHDHGWIDVPEDGHTVCPGDWIIKGDDGSYYPSKEGI